MNKITNNPNAAVSGITIALTTCIVWTVGLFGVEMSTEVGMAFAGVLTVCVLGLRHK